MGVPLSECMVTCKSPTHCEPTCTAYRCDYSEQDNSRPTTYLIRNVACAVLLGSVLAVLFAIRT